MKKLLSSFVLCFTLGIVGLGVAGLVSKPFTFSPNTLAKSSEVNSDFDTIYNEFNGNISDANISSIAAIQQSKINNLVTDLLTKLADTGDTITGELKSKYSTPCWRATGTEGSAKDWSICENAGAVQIRENTGSEGAPTWTVRYTLPAGAGGPATGTDLTTKTYVDGLTKDLGVGVVNKTDGDFTIASLTAVDITGLTSTFSTGARRARVSFSGVVSNAAGGSRTIQLQALVDGVAIPGTVIKQTMGAGTETTYSFSVITAALSAASHTFKMQALTSSAAGTQTLLANATFPAHFSAEELSK
jgi:hypothetical protein